MDVHEAVELVKALAWPCVVMYFLLRFRSQIVSVLEELPGALRRMRSAHGLGVEIELDRISEGLPLARREALALELKMPLVPRPQRIEGGERNE
jgi:hypothetical protein